MSGFTYCKRVEWRLKKEMGNISSRKLKKILGLDRGAVCDGREETKCLARTNLQRKITNNEDISEEKILKSARKLKEYQHY